MSSVLNKWKTITLTRKEKINHSVTRFWFAFEGLSEVVFKPGQFITLDLPIGPKPKDRLRSYSISSSPNGTNELELVIVFVENGRGTNYLFNDLKINQQIQARGPIGVFTLPEEYPEESEVFMICTGTGIAPFRSMIQNIKLSKKDWNTTIHLIFGSRTQDDLLYFEEMKFLEKELLFFHYHPTLSRENWDGLTGYVHPIYEKLMEESNFDFEKQSFFLCGWRAMIDETRKNLANLEVNKKKIHFELYG